MQFQPLWAIVGSVMIVKGGFLALAPDPVKRQVLDWCLHREDIDYRFWGLGHAAHGTSTVCVRPSRSSSPNMKLLLPLVQVLEANVGRQIDDLGRAIEQRLGLVHAIPLGIAKITRSQSWSGLDTGSQYSRSTIPRRLGSMSSTRRPASPLEVTVTTRASGREASRRNSSTPV